MVDADHKNLIEDNFNFPFLFAYEVQPLVTAHISRQSITIAVLYLWNSGVKEI